MNEEKKLKPVTFIKSGQGGSYYRDNIIQQNLLLKAMSVSDNPEDWKLAIGAQKMAEVYRTLDKLVIRKEFHQALVRQGITLDYIIAGIKNIAETANAKTALAAFQTFLKSIGMDKYDDVKEAAKGWEDLILEADKKKNEQLASGNIVNVIESEEYEVIQPVVPDEVKKKQSDEQDLADTLYGS